MEVLVTEPAVSGIRIDLPMWGAVILNNRKVEATSRVASRFVRAITEPDAIAVGRHWLH